MRSVLALMRASLLHAASYRLGMLLSLGGLLVSFVPLYFVSGALQPVVQESIRREGGQYFAFLIVGMGATFILSAAISAVPGALMGSIASGTLEALLVTRTPLPLLLIGMSGYSLAWNVVKAVFLVTGAALVGAHVSLTAVPLALVVVVLMTIAYFALGLLAGALVLVFRTSGPFTTGIIAASGLLGGVYYSTSVIPSWLRDLSAVIPLTYALRPIRMLLLGGASAVDVRGDVVALTAISAGLLLVASAAFAAALRHARTAGTLSQY